MGVFSVDTSDKLAGLCAAGLGIATCGTGVLPVGLAVAGAVLALPSIYKHFKGTDEKTYKSLINPPKAVFKKQFAAWEKSSEYTKAQLSGFNKALELLFGNLYLSPENLMKLGRNNTRIAVELLENASTASPSNFARKIDGNDNMDLAQANINRDLLQKMLMSGLEAFETTAEIEAKLQPFFQKELFERIDTLQEDVSVIRDDTGVIKTVIETGDDKLNQIISLLEQQGAAAKAKKAGISDKAIIKLAQKINEDVSDPQQAFNELKNAVKTAIKVQEEGHTGSNIDKFVDEVLKRVAKYSAKGEYKKAKAESSRAFSEWQERQQRQKVAGLRILQTDLELAQLTRDPKAAALTLLEIAKIEHPDQATRFNQLRRTWIDWFIRGRDMALLLDLQISEKLAELIINEAANKEQRGMAMNDRGIALRDLGERASGEQALAYLRDAVAASDLALEVRQRDTMPADWAMTLNNRANALQTLGTRASGEQALTYLRNAVAAYDLALEVYQRDTMPADWAMTLNNRANALKILGARASGEQALAYLRDAEAAFELALEVYQRDTMPAEWATAHNNRAGALQILGERASGEQALAYLRDAVAADDLALEVLQRDTMPADWAMTQLNRANALGTLGTKTGGQAGIEYLEQAIVGYDVVLEVYGEPGMEYYAEKTRHNREIDLRILNEMKGGKS